MESSAMPGYELPTGEKQNMTEADAFYKRETFDPAEQYKMENKRKGIAFIFNHERFFWHLTLPASKAPAQTGTT
jgi:hypothetical protein